MSLQRRSHQLWAVGLWAALLAGILVAWSPRYWAVSMAIISISIVTAGWMIASLIHRLQVKQAQTVPGGSVKSAYQLALVALIGAWGFLQIAFHTTLLPQLTLDSSIVWALDAGTFVVASQILRERAARRLFPELLMWSLTVLAVIAMVQLYSTPVRVFGIFPAADSVTGTLLSKNQFAAMMEFAAPLALWYMLDRNPLAGGLCYAMILAATFSAASRAGTILVCVELLVFLGLVLFARRHQAKAVLSVAAGLVLLVAVAAVIAGTDRIRGRFEERNPDTIRRELFDSTLKLIADRPWSGYGIGTWRAIYPRAATFDMALLANEAHNDWAQWASDGGIPFSLLMAVLVIWIAKPAIQSIWGLGVLSVMLHSYVDFPIREPALSFLWFALAGAVSQFDGEKLGLQNPRNEDKRTAPASVE
jgi:O-antigen ligase